MIGEGSLITKTLWVKNIRTRSGFHRVLERYRNFHHHTDTHPPITSLLLHVTIFIYFIESEMHFAIL